MTLLFWARSWIQSRCLSRQLEENLSIVDNEGLFPRHCLNIFSYCANFVTCLVDLAPQYISVLSQKLGENTSTKMFYVCCSKNAPFHRRLLSFSALKNCTTLYLKSFSNDSNSETAFAISSEVGYEFGRYLTALMTVKISFCFSNPRWAIAGASTSCLESDKLWKRLQFTWSWRMVDTTILHIRILQWSHRSSWIVPGRIVPSPDWSRWAGLALW